MSEPLSNDQMVPMNCPDCGNQFFTQDPGPDEVCPSCFEKFNGMTIEQLLIAYGEDQ